MNADSTDTFSVPEVHCGSCKQSIEGALRPLAGISFAEVDVPGKTVRVEYDSAVLGRQDVIRAIEEAGFDVASL